MTLLLTILFKKIYADQKFLQHWELAQKQKKETCFNFYIFVTICMAASSNENFVTRAYSHENTYCYPFSCQIKNL